MAPNSTPTADQISKGPGRKGRFGVGRATKLTPKLIEQICSGISSIGLSAPVAAGRLGISRGAIHEWIQRGNGMHPTQPGKAIHVQLVDAIAKSEATFEAYCLARLRAAADGGATVRTKITKKLSNGVVVEQQEETQLSPPNWLPVAWMLERTRSERYARQDRSETKVLVTGAADGDEVPTFVVSIQPTRATA